MNLITIRITAPSFPNDILERLQNYVLVSHQQENFHWHCVAEPKNITVKTFRNYVSAKFKGNAEYSIVACDKGMINYIFHPGSNWDNYKTDYLAEEDKLRAIADSAEYYENKKKPLDKKDIVDQIIDIAYEIRSAAIGDEMGKRIKLWNKKGIDMFDQSSIGFGKFDESWVRNSYKRALFRLVKGSKKLCPTSSNIKQYLQTAYIREGLINEDDFITLIAVDGLPSDWEAKST